MSLFIEINTATAGDVTVDITSSIAFDSVRIGAVDAAVGTELDFVVGTPGLFGSLTILGLPQDREIHINAIALDSADLVVETGNTIVINPFSWGDLYATYVLSDVVDVASEYRLYDKDTDTLLVTSPSHMMQDTTTYLTEDDADEVEYEVRVLVVGEEEKIGVIDRFRHNLPVCFVQGRLLDIVGDVRPAGTISFTPKEPKQKDRFTIVKPPIHRGTIIHRQAMQTLPGRNGFIGVYLPWDIVVTVEAPEYGLNADFVVPRAAVAELTSLTLVHRPTGPSNA